MELNTVGDWKRHFAEFADDMIVTITQKPVVNVSPAPVKEEDLPKAAEETVEEVKE
jgi:hypothetical protein